MLIGIVNISGVTEDDEGGTDSEDLGCSIREGKKRYSDQYIVDTTIAS